MTDGASNVDVTWKAEKMAYPSACPNHISVTYAWRILELFDRTISNWNGCTGASNRPTDDEGERLLLLAWEAFKSLGQLDYESPILSAFYLVTIGWMNISPLLLVELITVVSFWLAAVLMYYCALKITGNILGSVMAGMVYALAQVFLSQITEMHYFFLIGYALFPLLFIGILLVIRDHEKKWVLILPVIVIIIGSVADPQYVFCSGLLSFSYSFRYMLCDKRMYSYQLASWRSGSG